MRAAFEKFVIIVALGLVVLLSLILLPKFNAPLADALGAGIVAFLQDLGIALVIIVGLAVAIGVAIAVVKIKHMNTTHVIYDPKDNRPVRAVIHKGQLVQIAPTGVDLLEILKLQQQQAVHMQQHWKMIGTATTSMHKMSRFIDAEFVEADEGDETDEIGEPRKELPAPRTARPSRSVADEQEALLARVLEAFQIHAYVESGATQVGPRVIQLGVVPTGVPGRRTRIEDITKREKDIQLALRAKSIRILSPVPGTHYVGIEIPNPAPTLVTIDEVLQSAEYQSACATSKLVVALGRGVNGRVHWCDIEQAPHILIGGTTNAGKSVLINVLIASLLSNATPDDVRLLMVDPKMVELVPYNGIAHLLCPVITEMKQVVPMLKRVINEMERRYQIFADLGVRKLAEYRKLRASRPDLENLPAWVAIIDEFADLMMTAEKEVEEMVIRLAQKARATGIHLIIATQKPVVEVVTSLIKGNLPTKIALKTANGSDSRVILDAVGAEKLLGNGDLLYQAADSNELVRIQGAYMTNDQIQSVIASCKTDSVSQTPCTDELIGNAEMAGNAAGNASEMASDGTSKIIDGIFPESTQASEEFTEHTPTSAISSEKREMIRRLAAMNIPHGKIAKAVGLSGRNYGLYQQVCQEEGIVISQAGGS